MGLRSTVGFGILHRLHRHDLVIDLLLIRQFLELLETFIKSIFLDHVKSLLDSLADLEVAIDLLNRQLVIDVLQAAVLLLLLLGELDLNLGDSHRHELLLHLHELVVGHHTWVELLAVSRIATVLLLVVLLGSSGVREHHLHVDVGVHVHALTGERHLTWHHHALREVSHWHSHVLRLGHLHFLTTHGVIIVVILVLSQLCFAVCVRALVFVLAVSI